MLKGCFRRIHIGTLSVLAVMVFMALAISRGGNWLLGGLAVFIGSMILALAAKDDKPLVFPFFTPLLHLFGAFSCVIFAAVIIGKVKAIMLTAAVLLAIEIYQAIRNAQRVKIYLANPLDTALDLLFGAGGIFLALKFIL